MRFVSTHRRVPLCNFRSFTPGLHVIANSGSIAKKLATWPWHMSAFYSSALSRNNCIDAAITGNVFQRSSDGLVIT